MTFCYKTPISACLCNSLWCWNSAEQINISGTWICLCSINNKIFRSIGNNADWIKTYFRNVLKFFPICTRINFLWTFVHNHIHKQVCEHIPKIEILKTWPQKVIHFRLDMFAWRREVNGVGCASVRRTGATRGGGLGWRLGFFRFYFFFKNWKARSEMGSNATREWSLVWL